MNILFIFAHPDDEAFGPAGTIYQLSKTHNVTVASICQGNKPGFENVSISREKAFKNSCKLLGANGILGSGSDVRLGHSLASKEIEKLFCLHKPNIVYTHNISDLHKDHRLVAECVLVASRPKLSSTVKALYMCEMPSSTDWSFGQLEPQFKPNYYRKMQDKDMELKKKVMSLYNTETYPYPDPRSLKSMEILAMYRGKQVGVRVAEAFSQIFQLI